MINQAEIEQKIFTVFDKRRGAGSFQGVNSKMVELITAIKGIEKLDSILNNEKTVQLLAIDMDTTEGFFVPPLYILNFINELAKSINPESHLDPFLSPSSPCNFFDFGKTTAYCTNNTYLEIISIAFSNDKTKLYLGDGLEEIEIKTKFDLVTSFLPFGLKRKRIREIDGVKLPNDFASTLLIQSSLLLNDDGKGIFLVQPSFCWNDETKIAIEQLGLFVDAVFSIPNGALSPYTDIASNLIVITKQPRNKTFVAEIQSDEESNRLVLDNYKKYKRGKLIQLGTLINFNEFNSLKILLLKDEVTKLTKCSYPSVSLVEIALAINLVKKQKDKENQVEHIENSIYLSTIANSPVVTSPSEMNLSDYFQIQFNEEINAIYVAMYLNSDIGKKIRSSLGIGVTIQRISQSQLSECILHLPDLSTQLKIIDVDNKINETIIQATELQGNLWKKPKEHISILKDLKSINKEDRTEHWIDTLPFPLSSILWLYYTTKDNSKRVGHLLNFFEATSEFFSMVMLSALIKDDQFHIKYTKRADLDPKIATFGFWNQLTSRLSKKTRTYHKGSKEERDKCKLMYGNPSDAFLDMLS